LVKKIGVLTSGGDAAGMNAAIRAMVQPANPQQQEESVKKIGVITSGGDAPGMNAAIRAVVRTAIAQQVEVVGFMRGYEGIIHNEATPLRSTNVSGIIDRGGTILRSARSKTFRTYEGREQALAMLHQNGCQGLIVIGGEGSLTGALKLHEEFSFPVIGIPGSIDNDVAGTDYSIGFDTAVNTAIDAIDKVRDTAYSHDRVFVIEVMGRHFGFIAVEAGLAAGAEAILIPEAPFDVESLCEMLKTAAARGKRSSIIVVAEGASKGTDVADAIAAKTGFETRCVVLGHMQRGGSPTAFDRVLALRLGSHATKLLLSGHTAEMAGLMAGQVVSNKLADILAETREVEQEKRDLAELMAR
jgi:6-phosphofructokinase 1